MKKNSIARKLAALVAVGVLTLGGATVALAAETPNEQTDTVTITDESQLLELFPDATFRHIVLEAVRDGKSGAVGTDIEDALKNFTGTIDANGDNLADEGMAKIKDVHGIEYLLNAGLVDFTFNDVTDLSFLGQPRPTEEHPDPSFWHYEGKSKTGPNKHNVTWRIEGNPLENIPEFFGGRLVIKQAATEFSEYPNNDGGIQSYARDGSVFNSGTLSLGRVKVDGGAFAELDTSTIKDIAKVGALALDADGLEDNDVVPFSGLVKSGKHDIAIGTKEIICYSSADGKDTVTEGSQSYKYYLSPTYYVYDKVKLIQNSPTCEAQLVKTDEADGKPLAGAEYSLYKDGIDAPVKTGLTTDASGKLTAPGLTAGSYYFKETKAPDGYIVNPTPVKLVVPGGTATLSGGKDAVTGLANSADLEAGKNEVFIAGPADSGNSPDIELTLSNPALADEVEKVTVTYAELDTRAWGDDAIFQGGEVTPNVVREFTGSTAIADAETDVNNEKNLNNITGEVTIAVSYKQSGDGVVLPPVPATNKAQEFIDINGTKMWKGDDPTTRTSIEVELLQNGTPIDTATVSEDGGWAFSFGHLDKYAADGAEYAYTVREKNIPDGYTSQVTGDAESGFTIENTLEPTPPTPPEEPDEPGTPDTPTDPDEPETPGTPDTPADPGEPGKPNSPTPPPSTTTIPPTGDAVPVAVLMAMLGAACLALGVAFRKLRAKKRLS